MKPSLNLGTLSESEIISRMVLGEIELYKEIIRRYDGYLYKVGRSYGYNHADVEDLMQETYVDVFMNLAKFENRSSFKTWIVRIMMNECYHKNHKASFKNERPGQNPLEEIFGDTIQDLDKDVSETVQNNELKKTIEDAILTIPEDYRMVFTLRELNSMSVKETSEILHISEDNVKVRLHRSRTMLQNEIKKTYSPEEIFEFNLIYCDKMIERVMIVIRELAESHK